MKIITKINELKTVLHHEKKTGHSIGFVPTMGFLHEGHLSLIDRAKKTSDAVVISIFVNPTQFGPNEDFLSYPRHFEHDAELAEASGVDYLFYPDVETMYPLGTGMTVNVSERVDQLCGAKRPGHFNGVATVLTKLFNIIEPDKVFFGLKDAQQVAVVDAMIKHFHFPIEMVPCETIRESDGLAKSSRNVKLDENERKEAPFINKGLQEGKMALTRGLTDQQALQKVIKDYYGQHLVLGNVDYVQVLSYPELTEDITFHKKVILASAVQYGQARLIDNIIVDWHEKDLEAKE